MSGIQILEPRDVPLGGPRAMRVRRTLPQRSRSLIGAWCFVDHYGPDDVADTGGMVVPPHPHTGLQTVSWLFSGHVDHVDSAGNRAVVRPGEVNLMTAGRGISHSEYSTADTEILHGVQLWVALPDASREVDPGFEHHAAPELSGDGWRARVFLGEALGHRSPVATHTPLLAAELTLDPGARLAVDVDAGFELGVLVDTGGVTVDDSPVASGELAYRDPGEPVLALAAGDDGARVVLIGGAPLGEEIVMWWNFIGRSDEEVRRYRAQWQSAIGADDATAQPPTPHTFTSPPDRTPPSRGNARPSEGLREAEPREAEHEQGTAQDRFRLPEGDPNPPLPAPGLPNALLKPRG